MGHTRPVVMITGAGRGIGRATALAFAAAEYTVVLAELRRTLGRRAERMLRREGATAQFLQTDVARGASVARATRAVLRRFGRLDCVVNNAGVLEVGSLVDLPVTHMDRMLSVNLRGPLLVTRAVLPAPSTRPIAPPSSASWASPKPSPPSSPGRACGPGRSAPGWWIPRWRGGRSASAHASARRCSGPKRWRASSSIWRPGGAGWRAGRRWTWVGRATFTSPRGSGCAQREDHRGDARAAWSVSFWGLPGGGRDQL
ncbi:MAG: SDR family oxidoreductase [Candidatus Rokubacteria bacterium]|nr:SDR family oxidoreductase [Candidatus Rokubacteria bacterium]